MPEHVCDDVDVDHWLPRLDVSFCWAVDAGVMLEWLVGWVVDRPSRYCLSGWDWKFVGGRSGGFWFVGRLLGGGLVGMGPG